MLKTSKIHTCVVFDPSDGKIVHIEKKVRGFVANKGRDLQGLRVAFVEDTRAKDKHYRMDSKTLKFVELPDPGRGGRQRQ
jgi:hypothetical protein